MILTVYPPDPVLSQSLDMIDYLNMYHQQIPLALNVNMLIALIFTPFPILSAWCLATTLLFFPKWCVFL